jgi:hemolysin activation/secretion protein
MGRLDEPGGLVWMVDPAPGFGGPATLLSGIPAMRKAGYLRWIWLIVFGLSGCLVRPQELGLPPLPAENGPPAAVSRPFIVRQFEFTGNRLRTSRELAETVQTYTNRPLDLIELEAARLALTRHYIDHGYINSGAVIEQPPGPDGIVVVRIIEGNLTAVNLQGNHWLSQGFYQRRAFANGGRPLNVDTLRETLQLWREYYPVEQVNAELKPGATPGQATLDVKVKEKFPFHAGLEYANDKPPSTGAEQIDGLWRAESLTGRADPLALNYGIARASGPLMNRAHELGLDDLSARYALPFTPHDTTIGLQYARGSASVLEAPFDRLDIESASDSYGVTLTQPCVRTTGQDFWLSLSMERKSNRTWLLGVPYSFAEGAVEGKTVATALRFAGQYIRRSPRHVFAQRLTLSTGLDALDATLHPSGPSGRFISLLGQMQYTRRLGQSRSELVLLLAGQYSPDPLLTLEQLAIGGANTVRGYRENTMIRDFGYAATFEVRLPVWKNQEDRPRIQLAPFLSHGAGWNNSRESPSPHDIASAGIGLILTPVKQIEGAIYWGHAFREIRSSNYNLQDDGIHFRLSIWAF